MWRDVIVSPNAADDIVLRRERREAPLVANNGAAVIDSRSGRKGIIPQRRFGVGEHCGITQ